VDFFTLLVSGIFVPSLLLAVGSAIFDSSDTSLYPADCIPVISASRIRASQTHASMIRASQIHAQRTDGWLLSLEKRTHRATPQHQNIHRCARTIAATATTMPKCVVGDLCKRPDEGTGDCSEGIHPNCGKLIQEDGTHRFAYVCETCTHCAAGADSCLMTAANYGYAKTTHKCPSCMKNIHVICGVQVSEDLHLGTQCPPCHARENQASQEELARPQDNQALQENSTTPVQEELMTPERVLHEIRSQMSPENARRQTKQADSTFKKHNQENSRLLWWLYSYENGKHRNTCLDEAFIRDVGCMVNDISYTPRFLKELRMLNATEQASKKEKHIESVVMRNLIDVCLGQPGDSPVSSEPYLMVAAS
jgi:hypothetical protein